MPPAVDQTISDQPALKPLILVTHEFFPHRGGIAVYAAEMAKAAQACGHDVEVWAPALPPGVVEPAWSFRIKRLPLSGDHSLQSQWRMARHLRKNRTRLQEAILYIPEPGPLLALLLLQFFDRLHISSLVITFHGSEIQRLSARRFLRWSTKHILHKAARIGVVSKFAGSLLEKHFPDSAGKIVVTPGALRTDLAIPETARASKPSRKKIVLTVARINPRKGQLQVIEALKRLPTAQQALLEYWLVGSHSKDNYDVALQTAAQGANFPVKFLGDIPDDQLGDIYAQADLFAMTSMPHKQSVEGFGLVYLEAGAHGLPVIAHDIGGVAEAVAHGETGLLVAPGDQSALTAAFARLLDDPALSRQLGAAGRVRAVSHTWIAAARALFGHLPETKSPSPS
ncbi:glycosyltransferase family 4 protein [Oleiharenicola lentus]|uniref:glycosyltransferase family 4 protein n=1 Tax=Oleiharenicola lentus TaxID=2508720 RepID=UPI003F66B0F2